MTKEERKENKCEISAQYGKDEFKNLHFYCDYCGKEMDYDEDRVCLIERDKCPHCGADVGDAEKSVNHCFTCDNPI